MYAPLIAQFTVQYPLSPIQAFGIVLSVVDGKLADSKNFHKLKKLAGKDDDGAAATGTVIAGAKVNFCLRSCVLVRVMVAAVAACSDHDLILWLELTPLRCLKCMKA